MAAMSRRASTLAQGALAAALGWSLVAALDTVPGPSTPVAMSTATREPYPTCIDRFWIDEPSHPCSLPRRTLNPLRAATATGQAAYYATFRETNAPALTAATVWETSEIAEMLAGQTPTPCPVPPTKVPLTLLGNVRCFEGFRDATSTAGIENGESWGWQSADSADGTRMTLPVGTIPTAVQAWYTARPATVTAQVATAIAEATAGLPDLAMRNDQRRDRRETRRWWKVATATASVQP